MIYLAIGLIAYGYIATVIFCNCRENDEKNLKLKLIGYVLLGALSIPIKNIIIPIGFIFHIIRFKADSNREIKNSSAIMGFVITLSVYLALIF